MGISVDRTAGMLVPGGELVFTGKLGAEFLTLDEDTGKVLWQFPTSPSWTTLAPGFRNPGAKETVGAQGGWLLSPKSRLSAATCPTNRPDLALG
jgi:hypothetical protein